VDLGTRSCRPGGNTDIRNRDHSDNLLRKYHRDFAGATPRMFERGRAADGRCSYDLLADLVPHGRQPLTVLDLACGDGPLLQRLQRRRQPDLALVGIDLSPEELSLA
jgi:SAM-dependent methyltransferase